MRLLGMVVALGLDFVIVAGCISRNPRGIALYDASPAPPSSDGVAELVGPIVAVDGFEVKSRGNFFELLPGCHVVEIGGLAHHVDPRVGGEVATVPHLTYTVWMSAGNTYVIELSREMSLGSGPIGHTLILFQEQDKDGRLLTTPGRDDRRSQDSTLSRDGVPERALKHKRLTLSVCETSP
jgi:hypothetical protein